jgi:hypothetical protein
VTAVAVAVEDPKHAESCLRVVLHDHPVLYVNPPAAHLRNPPQERRSPLLLSRGASPRCPFAPFAPSFALTAVVFVVIVFVVVVFFLVYGGMRTLERCGEI